MPAIGGRQPSTWTLRDVSKETTSHTVYTGEITAISLPGLLTNLGAYQTALLGITNGVLAKTGWGEATVVSNLSATNPSVHRENKLEVHYMNDTTEEPYTLTIGTVDFAVLDFLPNAGDWIAITAGTGASAEIQAFVTAFETLARAPNNEAQTVTITGIKYVGRNT